METEKIVIALVESIDTALFIAGQLCEKVKPNTYADGTAKLIKKILNDAAKATEIAVDDMTRENLDFKCRLSEMYGKNVYD